MRKKAYIIKYIIIGLDAALLLLAAYFWFFTSSWLLASPCGLAVILVNIIGAIVLDSIAPSVTLGPSSVSNTCKNMRYRNHTPYNVKRFQR